MASSGLFCSGCGEINEAQAVYCRKCGARVAPMGVQPAANAAAAPGATPSLPAPSGDAGIAALASTPVTPTVAGARPIEPPQPPALVPPPAYPSPIAVPAGFRAYAGFWIRVLATLIDSAVLSIVILPIMALTFVLLGLGGALASTGTRGGEAAVSAAILTFTLLIFPIVIAIAWFYEAKMTSSSKQATVGKMVLGLKVIDKAGNRLTFLHATGRHFAKMINNFTFYVGWIMAGFTERKQGLHDIIVGTYVVRT